MKRVPLAVLLTILAGSRLLAADRLCLQPPGGEPKCSALDSGGALAPPDRDLLFATIADGGQQLVLGRLPAHATSLPLAAATARASLSVQPERSGAGDGAVIVESTADATKWTIPLSGGELAALRLIALPPGPYQLEVRLAHHRSAWRKFNADGEVKLGAVPLAPMPVLSGDVRLAGGKPAAGAQVALADGVIARTDAQGHFQVEVAGRWPETIVVSRSGMGTKLIPLAAAQSDTTLPPIEMAAGATLRVAVTRNAERGPLDVDVALADGKTVYREVARAVIPRGKSEVLLRDLDAGTFTVTIAGQEPLQRIAARAVVAPGGSPEVKLVLRDAFVHGRITLGGQPLPWANVGVDHTTALWSSAFRTDAKGEFQSAIWQDGELSLDVQGVEMNAPFVTLVSLRGFPRIDFALDIPDRSVHGRLIDEGGHPVANTTVELRSIVGDYAPQARTQTDEEGAFAFEGVRSGRAQISCAPKGYLQPDPVDFELKESEKSGEVNLAVSRGFTRRIEVAGPHGTPAAGALLLVAEGSRVRSVTGANREGVANVPTPAAEEAVLYIFPKEGSMAIRRLPRPLDDQSSSSTMRVTVPTADASLQVSALLDGGGGMPGVKLLMRMNGELLPPEVARELERQQGAALITDENGVARLAAIPAGIYEFWPYRSEREVEALMQTATFGAAPITVNVLTGDNSATIRFKKR
ncbi:MAG: Carboxypeptidase regulatory-like protein [Acidobacteria bacterium]|nr:Carboxypeptidase regulatory-like protein [Acidobacteriota bacterium]